MIHLAGFHRTLRRLLEKPYLPNRRNLVAAVRGAD